jgi:CYTH domain-containing protein
MAALKGAADGELEASTQLRDAARNGDAKAALSILQHAHGWTAKQEISMSIETINIQSALDEARSRVMEKMVIDVPHAQVTLTKDINGTTTNIPTRRRTDVDGGVMVAKDSG